MSNQQLEFQPEKDWTIEKIEKDLYLMTLKDQSIAQTGSAVLTDFNVNESHQLIRMELKHTDANEADASTNMTAILSKFLNLTNKSIPLILYKVIDTTADSVLKLFSNAEDYKFPVQSYRLSLNTTNLHLVFPELTIRRLP